MIVQVKEKWYEKLAFLTNISLYLKKVQDAAIVTMEDEKNSYADYRMVSFT